MEIRCAHCGATSNKPNGAVNRARKVGRSVYCDRKCAGLGRRKHKPDAQKRQEKRAYDFQYRAKNRAKLKAKKAAYHQRTYDPVAAARQRKTRAPQHAEYCRGPEYRRWKRQYDRQHRAKKEYGRFWECHLLVMDIRDEALSRQTDYEIRLEKGTLGKRQKRKRDDDRTHREELEIGALGNLGSLESRRNGGQPSRFHRDTSP